MLNARLRQFPTHQAGNAAANDTRNNCEYQIQRTDIFMVGRHKPTREKRWLVIRIMPGVCAVMVSGISSYSCHGLPLIQLQLLRVQRQDLMLLQAA
jgi:hypothetical protein